MAVNSVRHFAGNTWLLIACDTAFYAIIDDNNHIDKDDLFDSFHPSQQFFRYFETGLPGLNQY